MTTLNRTVSLKSLFIRSASLLLAANLPLFAQEAEKEMTPEEAEAQFMAEIEGMAKWEKEGLGKLGSIATVEIPGGFRYTGSKGAGDVLEAMGNPPSNTRKGLIAPEDMAWFAVFDWDDSGYVKDDDKDELEPDKLLKKLMDANEASAEARAEAGYGRLDVVGWAYPPKYNEETNHLEWALDLVDESGEHVVNFRTKLLGRHGVMDAILVCGPEELDKFLPEFQSMLVGYGFNEGKRYSEFTSGDKVAKGGLVALVAGGAVFAAAKTGLLSGLLVFLRKGWILVVAGLAAIGNWFKRLFGGREA